MTKTTALAIAAFLVVAPSPGAPQSPTRPAGYFGCYTYERYVAVEKVVGNASLDGHPYPDWESDVIRRMPGSDNFIKYHKFVTDQPDCRFWNAGEFVQVYADAPDRLLLCLVPAGSSERCYWTHRNALFEPQGYGKPMIQPTRDMFYAIQTPR